MLARPAFEEAFVDDRNEPPRQIQIQVELDPSTAQGVYTNLALVNHTETEFTIDFLYIQPQQPKATVRARIISSPKHTKRLIEALKDNVAKYEKRFGTIEAPLEDEPIVH
jgi:hypothetical protein